MRAIVAFILTVGILSPPHDGWAGGALQITSGGVSVESGNANSWMNRFSDWDGVSAVPTLFSSVTVTPQITTSDLVFTFVIRDRTHKKQDATSLTVGDKVIVQLNPNGSSGSTLEMGGSNNQKDYRYEITIKDNGIFGQIRRTRTSMTSNIWGASQNMTSTGGIGIATMPPTTGDTSDYVVTLTIPLVSLGLTSSPANNIGLAMLIVNDIGRNNGTQDELTAVTFPFGDMPASNDPFTDPGILVSTTAGGPWVNPSIWGTGYFSTPPGGSTALALSHSPSQYFSSSLKISVCDAGTWNSIDPPSPMDLGAQGSLNNWYKYFSGKPCKMGVWARVSNTSPAPATARLLVLWADGGLGANAWKVVELTDPIVFGPGDSTHRVVWDRVPSGGSSGGATHPCLKVYILPEPLNSSFGADQIRGITNQTQLGQFQNTYGFNDPWNYQVAQMNFTNLASGECTGTCEQLLISGLPSLVSVAMEALGPDALYAQEASTRGRIIATPIAKNDDRPRPKPSNDWVRVNVHGYAIPESLGPAPYVFLEHIGDVGWGIPVSMLTEQTMNLGFVVGNPPVLYRDFSVSPTKEIQAPRRRILLAASTYAPPGMNVPVIKLETPSIVLNPGETTTTTVRVPQTPRGSIGRICGIFPPPQWWPDSFLLISGLTSIGLFAWRRSQRKSTGDDRLD